MQTVNEIRKAGSSGILTTVLQILLSAVLLLSICNWHSIYEEDQMAKTAEITLLGINGNWQHFSTVIDYYSKDLFSAYYLLAMAFYKLTGLPALEALNLFSVLCGVIFFTVTPIFLKKVFGLPRWLAWVALVSCPILPITFTYGNEAALAIAMAALAALFLAQRSRRGRIGGAIFYCVAAYSRSDYLLLWPALGLLTFECKKSRIAWRKSIQQLLEFSGFAAILGLVYFLVVLKKVPHPYFPVNQPNFKLIAAFFFYSVNFVTGLFALLGISICIQKKRKNYWLLLVVFLQLIPYLRYMASPKYIATSVTVIAVFGMVGMMPLLKRAPVLLGLLLAIPWVVAVTPYGFFGSSRSVYWYVPTDDGPLPTGGFVAFFSQGKSGFYQGRYVQETNQVADVMPLIGHGEHANLIGNFNYQALCLWAVKHDRWDIPAGDLHFWNDDLGDEKDDRSRYLIRMSYLYPLKLTQSTRARLDDYYREGRVQAVNGDATEPFPEIIWVGLKVSPAEDAELGKRILFMNEFYRNNHSIRRDSFIKDFSGLSWILKTNSSAKIPDDPKPVYEDTRWLCFNYDVPGAIYYSMRFPLIYTRSRQMQ